MKILYEYDIDLLRWIQTYRLEALDGFFYYTSYTTTYVSISILIFLCIWAFGKQNNLLKLKFYTLFSMFISSALVTFLLKFSFARPRPFTIYPDIQKLSEAGSFSFPSGHTAEAFTMALGIMTLFPNSKYQYLVLVWALFVAYSRMSLGVHYPSDISASIVVAIIIVIIVDKKIVPRLISIET